MASLGKMNSASGTKKGILKDHEVGESEERRKVEEDTVRGGSAILRSRVRKREV